MQKITPCPETLIQTSAQKYATFIVNENIFSIILSTHRVAHSYGKSVIFKTKANYGVLVCLQMA